MCRLKIHIVRSRKTGLRCKLLAGKGLGCQDLLETMVSTRIANLCTNLLETQEETATAMNPEQKDASVRNNWESVHVCPKCGHILNLALVDLKAITTGIVDCPKCDWSGPIEIQIVDTAEQTAGSGSPSF